MSNYILELLAGELRRRAPHVVTNPEDFYVYCLADELLAEGHETIRTVPTAELDARIQANTLKAAEDYPDDLDVGDVLEVAGGFSVVTPTGRWHLTEGQAAELVDTLAAGLRRQQDREGEDSTSSKTEVWKLFASNTTHRGALAVYAPSRPAKYTSSRRRYLKGPGNRPVDRARTTTADCPPLPFNSPGVFPVTTDTAGPYQAGTFTIDPLPPAELAALTAQILLDAVAGQETAGLFGGATDWTPIPQPMRTVTRFLISRTGDPAAGVLGTGVYLVSVLPSTAPTGPSAARVFGVAYNEHHARKLAQVYMATPPPSPRHAFIMSHAGHLQPVVWSSRTDRRRYLRSLTK